MKKVIIENKRFGPRASKSHPLYRPDIDGLRALAVLSVVAFHASPAALPGGYVGVDVFFVISGFLITSIICRSVEAGRFSFADFYARRSKRIFPALIIVLVATWLCGWVILLPGEYEQLGKHMAAGAGFVSNFALWQESGYFDNAADSKPLLHLWSLGIEEQFYLIWPLVVVWTWRRKVNLLNIVGSIILVSFAVNVIVVNLWQTSAFYLPPARFWELLLGGALGYMSLFRRHQLNDWLKRKLSNGLHLISIENVQSAVGLALLAVAVGVLNGKSRFPGWWALLPTISAFLLINAGPEAWINRKILSAKPLVFLGLISYPLYLWHWPLLSFAHIIDAGAPSLIIILGAVVLALILASVTYWFVERPVRAGANGVALVLMPSMFLVGCLGLSLFFHQFHSRSEQYHLEKILEVTNEAWGFPGRLKPVHTAFGWHWQQGIAPQKVLFLGDSNVQQYYPRIDKLLVEDPDKTKSVLFVTLHGCAPVYVKASGSPKCPGLVETALHLAQADPGIDSVVIAAAWHGYSVFQDPASREIAFRSLEAVIQDYRSLGRKVYLILPIPANKEFNPGYMVRRSLLDLDFKITHAPVERRDVDAALVSVVSHLVAIGRSTGATAINPVDYLCQWNTCPTVAEDGSPIYWDDHHIRPSYVREHIVFLDSIVELPERRENEGEPLTTTLRQDANLPPR